MKRSIKKNNSPTPIVEQGKQVFYEQAYPEDREEVKLRSTIGFLYQRLRGHETHRQQVVLDLLPSGGNILDIGSGDGEMLFLLLPKFSSLFGLDIARTRVAVANKKKKQLRKKDQQKISFILSDADSRLPFDDRSLDVVTMVATLEHFFDPYQIVAEIYRVLKPGGVMIFQVPNLGFLPRRIAVLLGNIPVTSEDDTGWDGGHLHYFTVGSIKEFLQKTGFSCDVVTCSGIFAPQRQWWVSLLGADIIVKATKK